ncbi:MAG: T9SS type A sorting domain-containing protein [candidate division Zixibacteria bacterium]|nr:T9SS type A sorting domain-containing protein [candidate division Zixibacteria bacterium]
MLRRILAGLVVVAFVVSCSFTLATGSMDPLTYQPIATKGHQALPIESQQVVKLFLENTQGLAAASIPLSFGEPGSDIVCTEVSFEGSRVEHFLHWVRKDNENKTLLIGVIRALDEQIQDQLPPGEGLFATLKFESKGNSCKPQLSVTNWRLVGGEKLYFQMADAVGNSFYHEKIKDKQAARPIPMKPGSSEGSPVSHPTEFNLEQNYPNPFNPETVIKFSLKENSWVTLRIYNVLGQMVTTLVDEPKSAGDYAVQWNGKNEQNQDVASGVYFYRIKADDYESVRRMTLLR